MNTLMSISSGLLTAVKRPRVTVADLTNRFADLDAALTAAGVVGSRSAVIPHDVYNLLIGQDGIQAPQPIIVTTGVDADGNPITATLPLSGPCGSFGGWDLTLDPGARYIGVGII
jgi:hypothetical protein